MRDRQDEGNRLLTRRQVLQAGAGFGLAAATGTLLTACGSVGKEGSTSLAQPEARLETTRIRLFSVPPATCYAAMYMAEQFLREDGLTDVQYPRYTTANVLDKIRSGEIDFGIGYAAALIPLIDAGAPIVLLGGLHVGCWQVIGTGGIHTMRDFRGKTVSVSSPKFTDGLFIAMTLANVGVDIRKDVNLVTNPPTENARLLSSGEVDAVVAFPPLSTDLKAKGIGRVVLDSFTDPPWSNYYCCAAFANRTFMERNPVVTKRTLRAFLKGADVVTRDPDGSARLMVDRGYTSNYEYTCQILREIPYDIWREFDPLDSVRFYALRLKEGGFLENTPEEILKKGTDFRYLDELRRELKDA
ncbi:MAG TPA: ABC transporter substrate-binding protein [Acidimicrobiia bacterium]|nr:ABC transporter substrate-binding protein [Acidimicrobiia bacterium]